MAKAPKILKFILKAIIFITLPSLLFFGFVYFKYNEDLPKGIEGAKADALAQKMLAAVNHEAYKNTSYLEWTFKGSHHFKWNKAAQQVVVSWENIVVDLNIQQPEESTVKQNNIEVVGDSKTTLIEKAIAYFNNDSFWLVAPHKVFDNGVTRSIVTQEDGSEALLVTYTKGGNTPGDSYLWILDENGLPVKYKMWVSIIPLGGVEATWEDWKITESGVLLPAKHTMRIMELDMGEVKAR